MQTISPRMLAQLTQARYSENQSEFDTVQRFGTRILRDTDQKLGRRLCLREYSESMVATIKPTPSIKIEFRPIYFRRDVGTLAIPLRHTESDEESAVAACNTKYTSIGFTKCKLASYCLTYATESVGIIYRGLGVSVAGIESEMFDNFTVSEIVPFRVTDGHPTTLETFDGLNYWCDEIRVLYGLAQLLG